MSERPVSGGARPSAARGGVDVGFRFESVEWDDPRAVALRARMDIEMTELYALHRDPALSQRIDEALAIETADIRSVVLAIDRDGTPVGHAALRIHHGDWEVKRVIVDSSVRGRGAGAALMLALEPIAAAAGASRLILQTGPKQPAAVRLYERLGYTPIPVYEPYVEAIPGSLCFEKSLRTAAFGD